MTNEIKITTLGTADAVPTASRNHSAILLSYKDENILIDCGEGTQRQFRKANLNPCKLTRLLITHWHGDHILGIPGILQTLAFNGYNKTLYIYGPKGTKKFMKEMFKVFVFSGKIKLHVEEVSGKFLNEKDFYIATEKMSHGVACNAYNFIVKGQIRIDKEKLKRDKIPGGVHLKKLKQGRDSFYNGKKLSAKKFTFREGDKKISIVMDTKMNKKIIPFVKNADVLIMESSFDAGMEKKAREYKHMTVKQTAQVAQKAKVKKVFLTHISQRYEKNQKKILKEAKKIFKNSFLAKDLETIKI